MTDDLLKAFREAIENLPPPPKVDRVVIHDERALHDFQRRPAPTKLSLDGSHFASALTGLPVVIDPEVEVGVIEFRKGDKLVRRFHLPELRS